MRFNDVVTNGNSWVQTRPSIYCLIALACNVCHVSFDFLSILGTEWKWCALDDTVTSGNILVVRLDFHRMRIGWKIESSIWWNWSDGWSIQFVSFSTQCSENATNFSDHGAETISVWCFWEYYMWSRIIQKCQFIC